MPDTEKCEKEGLIFIIFLIFFFFWKGGVNSNALDAFLCEKESEAINHIVIRYEVFIHCEVTDVAIVSVWKELNELCQSTLIDLLEC